MKQTLWKIGIVLLILIGVDRGLAWYFDKKYSSNHFHYANGHLNYYLQKVHCDTLLLGSSRVLDGLVPQVFGPKTYSIAEASKHLGWCAAVLDLMQQFGRLPSHTLIINIEPEDFLNESANKLKSDIHYLKYYYDKNPFIQSEIDRSSPFEWVKYLSSLYRHNGNDLILLTNPLQKIGRLPTLNGYCPISPTPQDSVRTLQDIDRAHYPKPVLNSSTAQHYFKHIKSICQKNHIELIVITAPFYSPSQRSVECGRLFAKYLAKENIRYLNYIEKDIGELEHLHFWFDNHHFVDAGAQKFSVLVKNDVLLP